LFSFNRNEQIAILALTGLLIVGSVISAIDYFWPSKIDNFEVRKAAVEVLPPILPQHAANDSSSVIVVNLNAATARQLQSLPQIGPKTAARIVAHRESNGPFKSVEDLTAIRGIGPRTLDKLRNRVSVGLK
jgi:competence protein ComEA